MCAIVLLELVDFLLAHVGEVGLDLLHLLAVLLAQGLEVGFHILDEDVVVGRQELYLLYIHLALDEVRHFFDLRFHVLVLDGNHDLRQRLTHADVGFLAQREHERRDELRGFHALFQSLVDERLVGNGEVGQMDGFGLVSTRDVVQVAEDLLAEERRDGRHQAGHGLKAGVERLVGRKLVGVVFALPETAAREAHVPVAEVGVDELGDGATRTGRLIALVGVVDFEDEGVELREDPAVDLGTVFDVDVSLAVIELVDVGVQGEEGVGVVEGAEELAAHLVDASLVKLQVVPWLRVGDHIPTHGIGTVFLDGTKRVDGITQTF